jgi:RimJ/RimL family protein N-acetyltransferase
MEELIDITGELETERTVLKKYNEGEGKLFFEFVEKNRTRMFNSFPIILSNTHNEISAEYFIKNKVEEWEEKTAFNFGIRLKENGDYIGHISVKNIDWVIPRGEVAYLVSTEYEGKGFMAEALKEIIKFSFENLSFNRLFLRVLTNNIRSFKLAEKCGFLREGLLRKDHKTFIGELVDLYYYGLTREDYIKFSNQ